MANTITIHARLDKDLKENVDSILNELGMTPTDAIKLFYKQIELNKGLPFEIKVPDKVLAEKKLLNELKEGKKTGEEQGWLDIDSSKSHLGI